jgi:hypothetical protein
VEELGTVTMSDYKNNMLAPDVGSTVAHGTANGSGSSKAGYESALKNGRVRNLVAPAGQDVGGWDSYRRWLNRVQTPDAKRRANMDPALYTWKGYRNWSEKVRRDWKQDE